jgi:hypothetical protein
LGSGCGHVLQGDSCAGLRPRGWLDGSTQGGGGAREINTAWHHPLWLDAGGGLQQSGGRTIYVKAQIGAGRKGIADVKSHVKIGSGKGAARRGIGQGRGPAWASDPSTQARSDPVWEMDLPRCTASIKGLKLKFNMAPAPQIVLWGYRQGQAGRQRP